MMAETEEKTAGTKLLFNKWDASEVKVTDPSLMRSSCLYIFAFIPAAYS